MCPPNAGKILSRLWPGKKRLRSSSPGGELTELGVTWKKSLQKRRSGKALAFSGVVVGEREEEAATFSGKGKAEGRHKHHLYSRVLPFTPQKKG